MADINIKDSEFLAVSYMDGNAMLVIHQGIPLANKKISIADFGNSLPAVVSLKQKDIDLQSLIDILNASVALKINRSETLTATEIQLLVSNLVDNAPGTLNTLNELAQALNDDPNFATTLTTLIGTKVDKIDGYSLSKNDLSDVLKALYDSAYTHSQSAHAPSNAVSLATVKADSQITSAIANTHAQGSDDEIGFYGETIPVGAKLVINKASTGANWRLKRGMTSELKIIGTNTTANIYPDFMDYSYKINSNCSGPLVTIGGMTNMPDYDCEKTVAVKNTKATAQTFVLQTLPLIQNVNGVIITYSFIDSTNTGITLQPGKYLEISYKIIMQTATTADVILIYTT